MAKKNNGAPQASGESRQDLLKWLADSKFTLKSGKSVDRVATRSTRLRDAKPPLSPPKTRRNVKRKVGARRGRQPKTEPPEPPSEPQPAPPISTQPDESEYIEECIDMDEFEDCEAAPMTLFLPKDPVEAKLENLFFKGEPDVAEERESPNNNNDSNNSFLDHLDEDDEEEFHLPPGFEAEERDEYEYEERDEYEEAKEKKRPKANFANAKTLYCKICSLKYNTPKQLTLHKQEVHTGNKPYSCLHCGTHFEDLERLTAHLRRHAGKLPYCCRVCKQEFEYYTHYKKHQSVHILKKIEYKTTRVFPCQACPKRFRKVCDLERHLRVHTGEKPYSCNVCGNRFQQAHNLKKHLIIHTQERVHECDICKKTFGRSDVLTRHMIIHTVNKPCPCVKCGKSFGRPSQLECHMKKYHHT